MQLTFRASRGLTPAGCAFSHMRFQAAEGHWYPTANPVAGWSGMSRETDESQSTTGFTRVSAGDVLVTCSLALLVAGALLASF